MYDCAELNDTSGVFYDRFKRDEKLVRAIGVTDCLDTFSFCLNLLRNSKMCLQRSAWYIMSSRATAQNITQDKISRPTPKGCFIFTSPWTWVQERMTK